MDKLTLDHLKSLAVQEANPCVSIFMPTHRAGRDTQQDPIRLKNLLAQAEERLVDAGLRSPEARDVLQPGQALLDDPVFWRHLSDGLALFAAPGQFRTYRVPLYLDELVIVADRFHIKPLLPLLASDSHFFVLALSQNQVRLLEATRDSVDEVELEDVPTSLAEALPYEDLEANLQFQTRTRPPAGGGERAAVFHGHNPEDEAKDRILRYFRKVDEGLRQELRDERAPLVLAGVDYLLPIYRDANSYPHVLPDGITGNPDQLKAEELHEQAWALAEPHFATAHSQAMGDYAQRAGTGQTSDRLDQVVAAAHHGRVDVLWVATGTEVWGCYDPETDGVETRDEPGPGDDDLLDLAAVQTLLNGGTVHAVEPSGVPGRGPMAALLRY